MKSFLNDLYSVFKSRVAVIVFGLGVNVITARFLGPSSNGVIAALMVYPLIFMNFGSLGVQQATTYFVGKNKYDLEKIYGAILAIWVFTSFFCVICCYLLIHYSITGNYSNIFILLAVSGLPFSLYNTYSSGIFLGKQNIREYNRINWIPAALGFVFTLGLVVFLNWGIEGTMLATLLGNLVFSFFLFFKVRSIVSIKPNFDFTIIKSMLQLGSIYALSYLISFLNYRVDIILLEKLSTSYELGIYSKGAVIVEYLWQIPLLLSTIIFSKSAGSKDPHEFSVKACRLLRFAGIAILIAIVILYICSGLVINILYGHQFERSIPVLKILMPGVLLLTVFRVLNMDIAGKGKPWISIKAMLPAVILNIILNYFWIPAYGANGSALASTVSYSFAAVVFLIVYSKEVGIPVMNILRFSYEDKLLLSAYYNKITNKRRSK